jgi:AcrR family transcriptional regulator
MNSQTATLNVLRTLCLFGQKGGRLGISDVMQDLGVSRATAYRYLSNLEAFGLASRFGRGDFTLGPEVISLEKAARAGDPLLTAAAPVMGNLCRNTGATVLLERASGQRMVVAQVLAGPLGPGRLAEVCGLVDPDLNGIGPRPVQSIDGSMALKIWVHNEGGESSDRQIARGGKKASDGEQALLCLVDGERIDADVWARTVRLQGLVVGRLVALVKTGANALEAAGVEEQLRRSALRLEGRLEAQL